MENLNHSSTLYKIGKHWGLYENTLHEPWMISNEPTGEFGYHSWQAHYFLISTRKTPSNIIILYNVKLTLLIYSFLMIGTTLSLCKLASLTTVQYLTKSSGFKLVLDYRNKTSSSFSQRYDCTYCTTINDFFEFFQANLLKISCKGYAIDAKLFCLSTNPTQSRVNHYAITRGG